MATPTASVIHAHSGKNGGSSSSLGKLEGGRVGNGTRTVGVRVGIGLIDGIGLDVGLLLAVGEIVGTGSVGAKVFWAIVGTCVPEGATGDIVTGATACAVGAVVAGAFVGDKVPVGCRMVVGAKVAGFKLLSSSVKPTMSSKVPTKKPLINIFWIPVERSCWIVSGERPSE